jgi:m7GpppX diphosphatase
VLKASTIFPATEKHIIKYSEQDLFVLKETPELYEKITLKYIHNEQFPLDWLYNVLDHKKEQDRIIIEDLDPVNGFMFLPDLKWDGINKETLYCSAIVIDRTIKSIRDLREQHLPLLENIRSKCLKAIEEKFSIPPSQIRAYFHYQPSYYHLHVHFNYLKYDAPGIFCDKAHLLDTVIDNIKMMPNYYQKATLNFVARANDKLYKAFKEAENQED